MFETPSPSPSPEARVSRQKIGFRKILGLCVLGLAFGLSLVLWQFLKQPLLSPLTKNPVFQFLHDQTENPTDSKVVYGFLPYWNLSKTTLQPELTQLSYFSLTIEGDGSIRTFQDGGSEPGYNKLRSDTFLDLAAQAKKDGKRVDLVLSQFESQSIVALLNSEAAQNKLLLSIDAALLAYPFNGINLDIEYAGQVTPQLRENLTKLVTKINQHLTQRYSGVQLSIDMYAGAASNQQLWDVEPISKQVDYIVVMAYDFHRRSSPLAGPVAPLFGGKVMWDSDISQHLQAFLKVVPSQKILLGVPFYGYEWQTVSNAAQAATFPETGATASFERVQSLLSRREELKLQEAWNEEALSPYLSYQEDGETFIVYYENSRSLSYKLDLVNQLDLGGIAIWALGYEGANRELWDVIERKL